MIRSLLPTGSSRPTTTTWMPRAGLEASTLDNPPPSPRPESRSNIGPGFLLLWGEAGWRGGQLPQALSDASAEEIRP